MLVLSRRKNQSLRIGSHTVTVVEIADNGVDLRFTTQSGRFSDISERRMQRDEVHEMQQDVSMEIVDIRDDKVRIGVKCPPAMPVQRLEIFGDE